MGGMGRRERREGRGGRKGREERAMDGQTEGQMDRQVDGRGRVGEGESERDEIRQEFSLVSAQHLNVVNE